MLRLPHPTRAAGGRLQEAFLEMWLRVDHDKRSFGHHKCWRVLQPVIIDLMQPATNPDHSAIIDLTADEDIE
jgi:hypothetical protein